MSEDEDDSVAEEYPVYLSHDLEDGLFIFQYPLRPTGSSYDSSKVIKFSIKPENQEVTMEVSLDTQSNNYDLSHGEQIAINVDGSSQKNSQEKFFDSQVMDKLTFQSTKSLTDISTVAVACVKDKKVVLSPVAGVISMQPSFPFLDITDKKAKEEAKERGDDTSGGEEEEEKQITVKFARQESERMKKARERSFNYLSKKSAEEPWYNTSYHASTSEESMAERAKLMLTSESMEDQTAALNMKPSDYMDSLFPAAHEQTWVAAEVKPTKPNSSKPSTERPGQSGS
ncbi:DNA-directed RNA polymerase III subunit RPC5 [Nilaparvata lugens]|uniref:DNA-directed RNA polymerase III subunit RPC5 n=1 Tax=Nilaparvata lugens TaxID=108931 RepID=UPI00193E8858|nr:DNA-directed RNA polymerase III subunit RPC5 [Nilaparvata lugens]